MAQKKLETCPYVNRHKFCPKCGKDSPTVCGLGAGEPPVDAPLVKQKEQTAVFTEVVIPQAETLTFVKTTRGKGKRG